MKHHCYATFVLLLLVVTGCEKKEEKIEIETDSLGYKHGGPNIYPSTLYSETLEGELLSDVQSVNLEITKDLSFSVRAKMKDGTTRVVTGRQISPFADSVVVQYKAGDGMKEENVVVHDKGDEILITCGTGAGWAAHLKKN